MAEGMHTRSKQMEEQMKQMKETIDKLQTDFVEKLHVHREEMQNHLHQQHLLIQAQINQQQSKIDQQVGENKAQFDQISIMLSQMMGKMNGEETNTHNMVHNSATSPNITIPFTSNSQTTQAGTASSSPQILTSVSSSSQFQIPPPNTHTNIPEATIPITSITIPVNPIQAQRGNTLPEIPLINPYFYPNQSQYQFTPHPTFPHIPIPILPPPGPNIQTIPLNLQNNPHPIPNFQNGFHNNQNFRPTPNIPIPKIDFPLFTGSNPRGWLNRCERFFQLNAMADFFEGASGLLTHAREI